MDFGKNIKDIRKELNLTQEEFAQRLNVTRQAVSNWENNRNLPDIEMLLTMSSVFHISLDILILGGSDMNNMTEKLLKDGSENARARNNLIGICVGAGLLVFGFILLLIKGFSVEYIDADGFLHENFFLLPIAFLFMFSGIMSFVICGIRNLVAKFAGKEK